MSEFYALLPADAGCKLRKIEHIYVGISKKQFRILVKFDMERSTLFL